MRKTALRRLLVAGVLVASAGVATALPAPTPPGVSADLMTDAQLAAVRGGYLSANGLTFGFGAVVSTYVDGSLALRSNLTLTDHGVDLNQSAGAVPGSIPLDAATSQALGLAGLTGQGVTIGGPGGNTTLVQNLSGNQILNVLVNGASNRTISQNTAITLTLPAFNQLQRNAASQQLISGLMSAVGVGAVAAAHH